jgi:spermidine/putrescine transport system ATP-binding protein
VDEQGSPATAPPQIDLRGIVKSYGETLAVDHVDLTIHRGEFFSLLGPSGCGKSTILKLIAGFEEPDAGEIFVAGRATKGVPPEKRNIGFVFQNYALFPHMTVADNIVFGLEARGTSPPVIRQRLEEMLELVELGGLERRRPNQLSGGQQQRVALARALAIEPDVLLLDEPLGALDRQLRQSMQAKLVELQRRLGVTTIFVTHDQEEALTMSDRIAIMSVERHGFEQIGTPIDVYDRPASLRASSFIGHTNLWDDSVAAISGDGSIVTAGGLRLPSPEKALQVNERITLSVRPERIQILDSEEVPPLGANVVEVLVRRAIFAGEAITYVTETADGRTLQLRQLNSGTRVLCQSGSRIRLAWRSDAMRLLAAKIA